MDNLRVTPLDSVKLEGDFGDRIEYRFEIELISLDGGIVDGVVHPIGVGENPHEYGFTLFDDGPDARRAITLVEVGDKAVVTITVNGDTQDEGDQTFTVGLRGEAIDPTAIATVVNDDGAPGDFNFVFRKVNPDTNKAFGVVTDGFNFGDHNPNTTIAAELEGPGAEAVTRMTFELRDASGEVIHTRTEKVAPYALFGDTGGDFGASWIDLSTGEYTLTTTAYAGSSVLATETVNFSDAYLPHQSRGLLGETSVQVQEGETAAASFDVVNYTLEGAFPVNYKPQLSGADADKFTIDLTGDNYFTPSANLSFISAPDFEAPDDADGDGVYEVSLTYIDTLIGPIAPEYDTIDVSVTVTNDPSDDVVSPPPVDDPVDDPVDEPTEEPALTAVSLNSGQAEGDYGDFTTYWFEVSRSGPLDEAYTAFVNIEGVGDNPINPAQDVENEARFDLTRDLRFAPGQETIKLGVRLFSDEEDEGDETFALIWNGEEVPGSRTVIANDDGPTPDAPVDFVYRRVDPDSDRAVGVVTDGFNFGAGPFGNDDVIAVELQGADNVARMKFVLTDADTGAVVHTNSEGVAPYALFGDSNGDFREAPFDLATGSYQLTTTALDSSGAVIASETISFSDTFDAPKDRGVYGPEVVTVTENTTEVAEYNTTNYEATRGADAQNLGFDAELVGPDADKFQFNPDFETGDLTAALSFISAPDFEAPDDANGDGIYEVGLQQRNEVFDAIDEVFFVEVRVSDDPLG